MSNLGLQVTLYLVGTQPRDVHHSHLGDRDLPVAVDRQLGVKVDRTPRAKQQFVTRTDQVIRPRRHSLHRRKGRGHTREELLAKHGQTLADRRLNQHLELCLCFAWLLQPSLPIPELVPPVLVRTPVDGSILDRSVPAAMILIATILGATIVGGFFLCPIHARRRFNLHTPLIGRRRAILAGAALLWNHCRSRKDILWNQGQGKK